MVMAPPVKGCQTNLKTLKHSRLFYIRKSFMSFLLDELSQIDVTNIERFWLANALNTFGAKLKKTRNPH
jgi:hypothetical protein